MTREARQYTWLKLSVLGIGLALMAVLTMTAAHLWPLVARAVAPAKLSCGCAVVAIQTPWWLTGAAGLIIALATWTLIRGAWVVGRQVIRSRRYERTLRQGGMQTVHHNFLNAPVTIVNTAGSLAVTLGFWRPRLYISRPLLNQLSGSELRAVLAHERAHQRAADPLVTVLMDGVTSALRWLPGTSGLMALAYSRRELAADAQATDGYRQVAALSSAFLKLSDATAGQVGSAFSPNRDRLEKLLDQDWIAPRRWKWTTLAMAVAVGGAALFIGRYAQAITPVVPPVVAAACHETMIMCRQQQPSLLTCVGDQCVTPVRSATQTWWWADKPWTPLYAITVAR